MTTENRESLTFEELDWRPEGRVFERGGEFVCQWIPYLRASTVAHKLDEEFGVMGWRDIYEVHEMPEHLWCHIEVYNDEIKEWVRRTDVGKASNFESTKGMVSDAFKRCATLRWGVGRDVYRLPKVYAPCRSDGNKIFGKASDTDSVIAQKLAEAGHDVKHVSVDPEEPAIDFEKLGWASEHDCVAARQGLIADSGLLANDEKATLFVMLEKIGVYNPHSKQVTEALSQAQANAWADALEAM